MKVRYVINIDTRLEKSRCSVQWCLYKIGKKIRILYISSTLRSYNELFFIIWYGTFTLDDVWWFIWDTQLMFSVVDTAIDSKCHVSKRIERRPWFSKEADSDRRLPFSVSSHIYIYISLPISCHDAGYANSCVGSAILAETRRSCRQELSNYRDRSTVLMRSCLCGEQPVLKVAWFIVSVSFETRLGIADTNLRTTTLLLTGSRLLCTTLVNDLISNNLRHFGSWRFYEIPWNRS